MTETQLRRAIATKRDGGSLEPAHWRDIVTGVCAGDLGEAQLAALLMACVIRGLTEAETLALTEAFVASGETLVAPDPRTIDKHSSGGVGDTATLVVVPILAALGVPVAKLSGRALGHTGGTLDKLEALPGLRTDLSPERFFAIVARTGCAIAAQSARLVPADRLFYALRDRTSTVPSPGLIAASIVSKKIAGGAHGIVFDVKCGAGAFVREPAEALELAATLVALARGFGRRASALVSDMNEPLGPAIGAGLELCEARDFLRGTRRDPRLLELCRELARAMLAVSEPSERAPLEPERFDRALDSGAAYERFEAMLVEQGATSAALVGLQPPVARVVVAAERSGYVGAIAPIELGERARDFVAAFGPLAGIRVSVRTGDRVATGAELATVYGPSDDGDVALAVRRSFTIADAPPPVRPLVYGEIGARPGTRAVSTWALRTGSAGARSTLESK